MNKYFIKVIQIIFLLIILNLSNYSQNKNNTELNQQKLNDIINNIDKAPDFNLSDINDSIYILSKIVDKVILVNFWATWCGPCRMEIPEFNELYEKYHNDGFEILGISVSDSKQQLKNFSKSFKVDYPLLFGDSKQMNKIMKDYGGVYAVPSSFLIDKMGNIVWKYPGAILKTYDPQTFSSLVYQIEKALKVNHSIKK